MTPIQLLRSEASRRADARNAEIVACLLRKGIDKSVWQVKQSVGRGKLPGIDTDYAKHMLMYVLAKRNSHRYRKQRFHLFSDDRAEITLGVANRLHKEAKTMLESL